MKKAWLMSLLLMLLLMACSEAPEDKQYKITFTPVNTDESQVYYCDKYFDTTNKGIVQIILYEDDVITTTLSGEGTVTIELISKW